MEIFKSFDIFKALNPVPSFTVTLRQCETCVRDVDEKLRVPETFYMLLDMDRGTLAFQVRILKRL